MRWDHSPQENDFNKYQDNKTTILRQMRWDHLPLDNDNLNTKTTIQRYQEKCVGVICLRTTIYNTKTTRQRYQDKCVKTICLKTTII